MAKEKMYEVQFFNGGNWHLAKGEPLPNDGGLTYQLVMDPTRKGIAKTFREVVEGREFTCPNCGSHAFGTHTTQGVSAEHTTSIDGKYVGLCNGYTEVKRLTGRHERSPVERCNFTWPREEDDKYFKGTGHYSPAVMVAQEVKRA